MSALSPSNVAAYLSIQARLQPGGTAIIHPRYSGTFGFTAAHSVRRITYQELEDDTTRIARGLLRAGMKRGMRVALMIKPSPELFSVVFAMFKAGIVPVLIDPGIGFKHLKSCIAHASPEGFIGITQAHLARMTLGWGRASVRLRVTTSGLPLFGHLTLDQVRELGDQAEVAVLPETAAEDTAAVIFTSGSTGEPKGVTYSHACFAAQVELIRKTYKITPGEVDLPTFPLFAIFDPALGMTTVIPEMDARRPAKADPRKILAAIEDFKVTQMFGSPALLNRVGRYGAKHAIKLPTLKRVLSAGAPVPAPVLEKFTSLLCGEAEVFTPYGATESLPVSSISSSEILGETRHRSEQGAGTCVGHPVAGMDVQVIGITDDPIPVWQAGLALAPGSIGEIVVKGPVVTREYFGREAATLAAKIMDPTGGFFHRMGDLGYFDDQGRLWFCGRKSHRVVTSDETLFTIPCEGVFNSHPHVFRTALVGARHSGQDKDLLPVLCVELEKKHLGRAARSRLAAELLAIAAQHPHTKRISKILFHPAFPVDIRHNSKIFREKLALWAEKSLSRGHARHQAQPQ